MVEDVNNFVYTKNDNINRIMVLTVIILSGLNLFIRLLLYCVVLEQVSSFHRRLSWQCKEPFIFMKVVDFDSKLGKS